LLLAVAPAVPRAPNTALSVPGHPALFDPTISVGTLLTAITILLTAATIVTALNKDRKLRQTEYSDRIRRSAALVVAKVDRWRQLSLDFFSEIQPLITSADMLLTEERDAVKARDFLWRETITCHVALSRRKMDEQIEIAYSDMYGYDQRIHSLFTSAIDHLRSFEVEGFTAFLLASQDQAMSFRGTEIAAVSAQLGNAVRRIARIKRHLMADSMSEVVQAFQAEILKLLVATDSQIVNRAVDIRPPTEVFGHLKPPSNDASDVDY
jgi:hypothetical protein